MVSISLGAKVALIVTGACVLGVGALLLILTFLWWGRIFDSILFFMLFLPFGMLLMISALVFGTKPRRPKYPGYPPFYEQYPPQGQYPPPGQYPPQPQDFESQQKMYKQMYDQAYQYAYQQAYWNAVQKFYEQMYKPSRQPFQSYQQYYPYPM